MLRLLRHLLCVWIVLGLAGNGVAMAAPCSFMTPSHASAMASMPDCDMPMPSCSDCASKTNKTGKSGCMMMLGCTVSLSLKDPTSVGVAPLAAPHSEFWPVTAVLAGRNVVPEPEPPSLLG